MPYDRFMIAPLNTGLHNNVKPWLIPDEAFAQLDNAYIWRGRLRKRFGTRWMGTGSSPLASRVRINLGATVAGALAGTVPGATFAIGQLFSIGTALYTVVTAGAVQPLLKTVATTTATFSTTNGAFNFVGAPAGNVYFYPATPIMGLITYDQKPVNQESLYAFDTQFAYYFDAGTNAWERLGTALWTGNNSNFFWGANFRGTNPQDRYLYVTNFNSNGTIAATDPIKYWDGAAWNNFTFAYSTTANSNVYSARIIIPFKQRLLLLNTWESVNDAVNVTNFVNRIRFCQVGSPLEANAWQQPPQTYGKGGFIDLPTTEQIVSAQILKDRLIIFCERSTWELVATGNQVTPFVEQSINIELGVESQNSIVVFDKVLLAVGNVGIMACNALHVERIDADIPDEVFQIHDGSEGPARVQGIRDYYTEMVYWTFPNQKTNATYPNRVLVYNYSTGAWAFNDDSFTAWGYFQTTPASAGITWSQAHNTWASAHRQWSTPSSQAIFQQVVAGNQEGFVVIVDRGIGRNAPALSITQLTTSGTSIPGYTATLTVIDHNLLVGDYVLVENCLGITGLNTNIYRVDTVVDSNTITLLMVTSQDGSGTYTGGGTIARVSNINILTKEYNFYVDEGRNCYVAKADFLVERTSHGAITVDYYVSTAENAMVAESAPESTGGTGANVGTNVLETSPYSTVPFEASQTRLWHPVYFQADGEFVQLNLYFNDTTDQRQGATLSQIRNPQIALDNFELHAITFSVTPTASRLQ
jgi:hypothetical protein